MSQIFISYSRKDSAIAEKIVNALAKDDLEPWIDWKSIPKGEEFKREIFQGIEKSDIFLFLVSPDSVRSKWCQKEINCANKNGKRILPIVVRNTSLKLIPSGITKRNWIFCREGRENFRKAIKETRKTIDTDYEWLKYHTKLQMKALDWERHNDNSRLLRGKELQEAERQLSEINDQDDPRPTKIQREFILSSRRNEERQRSNITIGLSVGLAIMVALLIFAWIQRNDAISKGQLALARQLVAQAQSINVTRNSKQMISILLATRSMQISPSSEAAQVILNNTIARSIVRITQDGESRCVIFSPDGKYVVSSGGPTILILEKATGKEISRMKHDDLVYSIAISPDGKYVASGSRDKTTRVWDARTGNEIARMTHNDAVLSVAFSPDGKRVVSGSWDHTVRVWEVITGTEIALMTHDLGVETVAFSPDNRLVVSGSNDGTARVWEAETGNEVAQMTHEAIVDSVTFSPDGRLVVSADTCLDFFSVSSHCPCLGSANRKRSRPDNSRCRSRYFCGFQSG